MTTTPLITSTNLTTSTFFEEASVSLECFKYRLKFIRENKDLHIISKELFDIAPKTLELIMIIDVIFKECYKKQISLFLNAIFISHPSFRLSSYDTIREKIVKDEKHELNNSSLIDFFKEHGLETDQEKLTACYDLAYRVNHPYIYCLSETPILSTEYSLNFLWINLNPQDRVADRAQNIFGDGLNPFENADSIKNRETLAPFEDHEESLKKESLKTWRKIKKTFSYRISKWADINKGAEINLWYDSALVTRQAQQNTFGMMQSISQSRGVNLQLRDIRNLSNTPEEIKNSLHPGTQIYYRVDILKALIADYMIRRKKSAKYCVVSDIDVKPMGPDQLFDKRTLNFLSFNGYVFNRVGLYNFENSFFIFNKENERLKKVHFETIIDQTVYEITSLRKNPINSIFESEIPDAELVFKNYSDFEERMDKSAPDYLRPRKVVKCPASQFNHSEKFDKSHFRTERFRFIGASNVPYTTNGRNFANFGEGQIPELIGWKAEPLPSIKTELTTYSL